MKESWIGRRGQERLPEFDLPRLPLCLIVAGCLSTVILRWFRLRGIRV